MSDPKIVASGKGLGRRAPVQALESHRAWAVLGWIGLAFLAVGGSDFVLTWFPLDVGNPEWEFGTVTASFNGLPILVLGVALLVVAGQVLERRWWNALGLGSAVLLVVWILVGFVLWSMTISLALQTVPDGLEVGVRRAVVKTAIQIVVFGTLAVFLAWRSWSGREVKDAKDRQGEPA